MKLTRIFHIALAALAAACVASCSDDESYANLLNLENQAVNNYLADHTVELSIPEDTVFITGPDAPYYRLDEDGFLYMQVLDAGTKDNRAEDNEQIYFRYLRYALTNYDKGYLPTPGGNALTLTPCWFRFNNYSMQGSYQWGVGLQTPLKYLPIDCKVNIIIKSNMGIVEEQSEVTPFLYNVSYYRGEL